VKRRRGFTRLEEAGRLCMLGLRREGEGLEPIRSGWSDAIGSYLARRVEPARLRDGRLELRLLDPTCRRDLEALAPEIERRILRAFPRVRSVDLS
jgi:hypothetical protein